MKIEHHSDWDHNDGAFCYTLRCKNDADRLVQIWYNTTKRVWVIGEVAVHVSPFPRPGLGWHPSWGLIALEDVVFLLLLSGEEVLNQLDSLYGKTRELVR